MTDLEQLLDEAAGPRRPLDVDRVQRRVTKRARRRAARRGVVAACVALVAVLTTAVVLHDRDEGGLQVGGSTSTTSGPRNVASLLFELTTSGPMTVDPATGARTALDVGVNGKWCDSCTSSLARAGSGVAFVLDDHAYSLPDVRGHAVDLGPAKALFEAVQPDSVWIQGDTVRRVDVATGAVQQEITELPPASRIARIHDATGAALPQGLLLQVPGQKLAVWNPDTGTTGWATSEAAHPMGARSTAAGSMVAWVTWACDGGGDLADKPCDLHVSNLDRGTDTVIPIAAGTAGYQDSAQFSPDGRWLAVPTFTTPGGGPDILALVDLRSGAVQLVDDSHLDNTAARLAVKWSVDGAEVFVTADDGQPTKRVVLGAPRAVDFTPPLSWSFTVVPAPSPPAPSRSTSTSIAASASASAPPGSIGRDGPAFRLALLDGTLYSIGVPVGVFPDGPQVEQLTGSVYADETKSSGWSFEAERRTLDAAVPSAVEVALPPSSHADHAVIDETTQRLGLQYGPWAVVLSGSHLAGNDIDVLLSGFDAVVAPDGTLHYRGTLPLGRPDAPDVRIEGSTSSLFVYARACPSDKVTSVRRTAHGLLAQRIDNPSLGGEGVSLCLADQQTEVVLVTPTALTDEQVDQITIDRIAIDDQPPG